jgi:hypothetical protein
MKRIESDIVLNIGLEYLLISYISALTLIYSELCALIHAKGHDQVLVHANVNDHFHVPIPVQVHVEYMSVSTSMSIPCPCNMNMDPEIDIDMIQIWT